MKWGNSRGWEMSQMKKKVRRPVFPAFPIISHRQICFLPPLPSAPSLFFHSPCFSTQRVHQGEKRLKRLPRLIRPRSSAPPLLGTLRHSRSLFSLDLLPSPVAQPRSSHDGGVIDPTVSWEPSPQWYACSPHLFSTPATLGSSASASNS